MMLTLLLGAIVAPCVRADTAYTATFACSPVLPCEVPAPTAPDVTFQGPTLDIVWNSQSFDLSLPAAWLSSDSYSWLASNGGFYIFDETQTGDPNVNAAVNTDLPDGTGGPQTGALDFAAVKPVATPEPGIRSLMLIGLVTIAMMMVMRKRIARGLPQSS